jgi:two-component system sensor histidine kinase UhpB
MPDAQITHQSIFRYLIAGFSLVILLLAAAAVVAVGNIRSVQSNAASLIREESVTNRLIDELQSQQTSLSEVFSILARDPDTVDSDHIMAQLDEAVRDIARISAEGAATGESRLWARLKQSSDAFCDEARRLLTTENVETYASSDLFRHHAAFLSVAARLIEIENRKMAAAQVEIDRHSARLLRNSAIIGSGAAILALIFAGLTIALIRRMARSMEEQADQLSRVSWQMLANQEETARRFSHELHDELGQSLTAVKTNLAALDAGGAMDRERLADCTRLVDDAIGNVRQMSQLLRPTILDDFGLEAGLRWLCEGFAARTGIHVKLDADFHGRLADQTETHLFRIAQEAMTNIARHAGAKQVRVHLAAEGQRILLSIEDDGRGIAAQSPRTGFGLSGMRARARSAGGDLAIRAAAGHGVRIEVRVPLNDETYSHIAG